ncbi:MAG: CvpA family protein [Thermoguttaceae bacterium]
MNVVESIKNLPAFDLFVIVFLIYCVFLGGRRGIFTQVTSILALIASWYAASRYSSVVEPYLPLSDSLRWRAASIVTFFVSMIGLTILAHIFGGMFKGSVFREVDRQMGAFFGLVKGGIVCLIITYFSVTTTTFTKNMVLGSQSGWLMVRILCEAQKFIPENEQTTKIRAALDEFQKSTGNDAIDPNSSNYQISTLKQDIADSMQKLKEKSSSLMRTVDNINSFSNSPSNLQNKSSSGGSARENAVVSRGTPDIGPIPAGTAISSPQAALAATVPPSQHDVIQRAKAIFSGHDFRSTSPVDPSEGSARRESHRDIYSPTEDLASSLIYTPRY